MPGGIFLENSEGLRDIASDAFAHLDHMWFFLPSGLGKITYGLNWSEIVSQTINLFDFPCLISDQNM